MAKIFGANEPKSNGEVDLDSLPPHPRNVDADEDEFVFTHVTDRPESVTQLRARIELDFKNGEPIVEAAIRQYVEKGIWNDRNLGGTYRYAGYSGKNGPRFKLNLEQLRELHTNVGAIIKQIDGVIAGQR